MSANLDPKAVRFIIDAINCKIDHLKQSQTDNKHDENLCADASNDIAYYGCIIEDLKSIQGYE
jgi:hypothetical protein